MERNATFPGGDVRLARLKLTWAQLELVPARETTFQLMIAGDDQSVEELRIELSQGELTIAQPQLTYAKELLPRRRWLQICLCIPKDWPGNLDVDSIAGTVGAHTFTAANIALTTVSGSINVKQLQATGELKLHTVSGGISATDLIAPRGNLRSVSGVVTVEDATFTDTKIFTVSGDITLSVPGSAKTIDMQSVSGSLCVETDGPVQAALHALSGQFLLDDQVETSKDGTYISVSSVSGDLAVKRRQQK